MGRDGEKRIMVTREENEMLTSVEAGTPGGELLRRYWQPVAAAAELTDEAPIKKVRVLGEDLVVYRDKAGRYGLVGERCRHRLASLAFGRVDEEGIRCPYHGWKYDATGRCLEMPAEPKGSTLKNDVRNTAYPVEKLGGLLFAYMGPLPAPALPRWDVLAWEHGRRWIQRHSVLQCNWLQAMENSVDPSHLYWLHGASAHLAKEMDHYEEEHEFITFEYGVMKRRITPGKTPDDKPKMDQHPLLFPNTLRHVQKAKSNGRIRHNLQIRVPIDNENTQVFVVFFEPSETERVPADADAPVEFFPLRDADGRYRLEHVLVQDAMAWETQGAVMDRSQEFLAAGDRGIVIFRRLLKKQIEAVRQGETPLGVLPEGAQGTIELDVVNERIGVVKPQIEGAA
jgi:5,5'-dehydrodivanillate O-demethylase